jgi:hypothetical protein
MTRAVLIHAADGPGAIAAGERDVREPRIGEVLIRSGCGWPSFCQPNWPSPARRAEGKNR